MDTPTILVLVPLPLVLPPFQKKKEPQTFLH
jgi:hypothetical protein